ncbi:MAG: 30S ribosome-binding factor RbfA [Ruminococcaceae bacterium]|nr:30S ribosome-binding factor RbfA [Oscillospiraceae bacterium]
MANNRIERIKEEVLRELASVIRSLKDPRIPDMTSVVAVDVTKDLKYAKAHVSIMGSEEEKTAALAALKSASGFIRREISARLNLRITPEFTFVLDRSVDYGIRINDLISKINKGDL